MTMQIPIGAGERQRPGRILAGYLECIALIERLHRLLLDVIKDEFERLDVLEINPVQALLLFNIAGNEVTAGELRSRGYYQGSNVSYNLKKLVETGYLHHQRSEVDRRSVRIRLTPKGVAMRATVGTLLNRHAEELERESAFGESEEATRMTMRLLEEFWSGQIRYIY